MAEVTQPVFARHNTFHPRFGWLKKGFDAAIDDADAFGRPAAPSNLGVGKNMVRAIRYWCLAMRVLRESPTGAGVVPTQFGLELLANEGWDPYLEDLGSLWLLHWRLTGNADLSTAWWLTFFHSSRVEFTVDELTSAFLDLLSRQFPGLRYAESSLQKDASCIVRMYGELPRGALTEDSIHCPFAELGLMRPTGRRTYAFQIGPKQGLSGEIVAAAACEYAAATAPMARTVALSSILRGIGSPGLAFRRALVLGESIRPKRGGGMGIGRFGLGMTLGALSLARRVDLWSRASATEPFRHTYLDLNEIRDGKQKRLPHPKVSELPAEYAQLLDGSSGTVVVLTDADRVRHSLIHQDKPIPADEQIAGLSNWLGRTYRKFIARGTRIWLDGEQVYLHDPLYLQAPTYWDAKGKGDPKAKPLGTREIELEVPGKPGETAKVKVTMSLLPREFRMERYKGKTGIAKERRIDENEGISILRADREVLYGRVPYLTPEAGRRGAIEVDRFWGCEVEFPPELDQYFEVRYIKRGAQPVPNLRKQLRDVILPTVVDLRELISQEFDKSAQEAEEEKTVFAEAEETMAAVAPLLPRGRSGADKTQAEAEAEIDQAAAESAAVEDAPQEEKEQRRAEEKKRLKEAPYAIVAVRYPANVFFETVHLLDKVIVKLNMNHPFYTDVFEPLCGSVETLDEDADVNKGAITPEQRRARSAFMLLILSYAQAESMFGQDGGGVSAKALFEQLRGQWGMSLSAAIQKSTERGG